MVTTHPSPVRPPGRARWFLPAFVAGWFLATALFGAWTVAQHVVPIPPAHPGARPVAALPRATHVLGADCGCSASIADDLIRRGPRAGWQERVLFLGLDSARVHALRAAGFAVSEADAETLAQDEGIQGAPWLVLHFADGRVAYNGGYARLRPGLPGYENLENDLMGEVAAGRSPAALRAYGCATSRAWQGRLDPLGLRYPASR